MHTMNSTEQNKGGNFCMNNEKTYKLMGRVGGGTLALGIIVLLLIYSVVFANVYYGGIENMMRESCTSLGIDYNMLFPQN